VISSVVVSYQVRPEAVAEHVRLIEAVFTPKAPLHRPACRAKPCRGGAEDVSCGGGMYDCGFWRFLC